MDEWLVVKVYPSGVMTMSAYCNGRRTFKECFDYSEMMNRRRAERFNEQTSVNVNYMVLRLSKYRAYMELTNSEDQA
jgi:hypothetical protein